MKTALIGVKHGFYVACSNVSFILMYQQHFTYRVILFLKHLDLAFMTPQFFLFFLPSQYVYSSVFFSISKPIGLSLRTPFFSTSVSILMIYLMLYIWSQGFPGSSVVKNPFGHSADGDSIPVSGRCPGDGNGYLMLPGKSHRQRSLAGYSPWGHKEMDMT